MTSPDDLIRLEGGRTVVYRRGSVVIRETGPWTPAVHALLRHLEEVGFAAAPRLVGSGLDHDGREMLTFIDGEFTQPGPWSLDGAAALGALLRDLHRATATFRPPADAVWFPWHGRDLGGPVKVIGHCDVAPWNIVARSGMPVALIDWETAGQVDPLVELAQLCWLNAKLHDDIVAQRDQLPPLADRARQRLIGPLRRGERVGACLPGDEPERFGARVLIARDIHRRPGETGTVQMAQQRLHIVAAWPGGPCDHVSVPHGRGVISARQFVAQRRIAYRLLHRWSTGAWRLVLPAAHQSARSAPMRRD